MIEKLDISQKAEILDVLRQAFATHPMLPPGTPAKTTERMFGLMLDTLGNTDRAYLHGIREEGRLACVAFSLDAQFKPSLIAMCGFLWRIFRILGWRLTLDFAGAFSKQPKHEDAYLELMLFGTLPASQGRGLGREMLQWLYRFCGEEGYKGIVLGAAKDTPSYDFYCREGFVTESEAPCSTIVLCYMRRDGGQRTDASPSG
jgi:GNAT superfamily N-acetyltransferase